MNEERGSEATRGTACRVRVRGRVGPVVARSLPGFRIMREDGTSLLEGRLPRSQSLVGLLLELQDLGLEVLDLERADAVVDAATKAETGTERARSEGPTVDDG